MTWEDYDQAPGWPQAALPVRKLRGRPRRALSWRHRKVQPLWFRALKARGALLLKAAA